MSSYGRTIVACLTTIPSRVRFLEATIESLHDHQTWPVNHIFLFLPRWSTKEDCTYPPLPFSSRRFPRLRVLTSERDHGPITKLVPILESGCTDLPDSTWVLICDDDRLYSIDTVETLVRGWHRIERQNPASRVSAVGCSGVIASNHPTAWTCVRQPDQDTPVDILEGTYGVLHSLGLLRQIGYSALSDFTSCPEARYCDDIWTSTHVYERRFAHDQFLTSDQQKKTRPLWVVPMRSSRVGSCHRYNSIATNVQALSKNVIDMGKQKIESSFVDGWMGEGRAWLRNWHVVQALRQRTKFALRTPLPQHSISPSGILFKSVGTSLVTWPILLLLLMILLWTTGHWMRWVLSILFVFLVGLIYLWLSISGFFSFSTQNK